MFEIAKKDLALICRHRFELYTFHCVDFSIEVHVILFVLYGSCGSCAYPLNLKSSDQIASAEGSGHKKSTKKDFVSFQSIDPSRFTQEDDISCFPIYFGRNRPKTKLLCRKCGAHIGRICVDSALCGFHSPNPSRSSNHKFYLNILALQPSSES